MTDPAPYGLARRRQRSVPRDGSFSKPAATVSKSAATESKPAATKSKPNATKTKLNLLRGFEPFQRVATIYRGSLRSS
jgi:hypothetical protein